jgi:3-oxoadipate enol-lactonase
MPIPTGSNANVARVNATELYYELSGSAGQPAFVLSNSLGTNLTMWDSQMSEFTKHFRVLRYDTRGHGKSQVSPGPYSLDILGRDALALTDHLGIGKFSFCGLSMGGVIGMWLATNASYRLHKVVLCSTAAKIGSAETWNARIAQVHSSGTKSIAGATMERWFTPAFRQEHQDIVKRIRDMVERTSSDGYIACCEALREADFRESLKSVRTATLVISGTHDPATTPADGRFITDHIPGAHYVELDAAHMSNIERQEEFTKIVLNFLRA